MGCMCHAVWPTAFWNPAPPGYVPTMTVHHDELILMSGIKVVRRSTSADWLRIHLAHPMERLLSLEPRQAQHSGRLITRMAVLIDNSGPVFMRVLWRARTRLMADAHSSPSPKILH